MTDLLRWALLCWIGFGLAACDEPLAKSPGNGSSQPAPTSAVPEMKPADCAKRVAELEGWGKRLIAEGEGVLMPVQLVEVKDKPNGWRSGAPQLVVGREQVLLNGKLVAGKEALTRHGRFVKDDEISEPLEAMQKAIPQGKPPLVVDLMVDPEATWLMVGSVANTAAFATSYKVRFLFETGAGMPAPPATAAATGPAGTLWKSCPEADQALKKALGPSPELSAMQFTELFFQTMGKPIQACGCRVDFAALESNLFSRLRPPSGNAVYSVAVELFKPPVVKADAGPPGPDTYRLFDEAPVVKADADAPWRDTYRFILEAAKAGKVFRFGRTGEVVWSPPPAK